MSKKSKVIEFPTPQENTFNENKKRRNRKRKKLNLFNLIFVVFILYFSMTYISQKQMADDLDKQISILEKERDKSKTEAEKLSNDVSQIDDKEVLLKVVERIARNEYKMVKPNEIIYIDKNKANNKFIMGIGNTENEENSGDESSDSTTDDSTDDNSDN